MVQTFKGFSDRARILKMLALYFGASDGEKWFNYLGRLLNGQRRWPWFGLYLRQSPRRAFDLLDLAASELILLASRHPGVPLDERVDGGSSLLVQAWVVASAWAWKDAGMTGKGVPRVESMDALLDDNPNHPVAQAEVPAEPEPPDLDLSTMSREHRRLLAARASGLSFQAIAAAEGMAWQTLAYRYRQAVRTLIGANPWMVGRYGLAPCADHRTVDRECPVCKGFGFTYMGGEALIHRRQR